jgi:hypothetical protein
VHDTELICQHLHLLLHKSKDQDLLVLIELTITTLVKHIQEFSWSLNPEQIVNLLFAAFEDQSDVCFIQNAFLSEVSFSNGLPNLLALSSTSYKRP